MDFPKRPSVVSGKEDGYDFAVEVIVGDIPVAVVHVKAQTFDEAKKMVLKTVTIQTADRLLPIIVHVEKLEPYN
jgi:hypothetical protein